MVRRDRIELMAIIIIIAPLMINVAVCLLVSISQHEDSV